jgi:hypothetical protein
MLLIDDLKAVDVFLTRHSNRDFMYSHGLEEIELRLLMEIRQILLLFHSVQELLSSERTPTLAVALPAYEYCMTALSCVIEQNIYPHLNHALHSSFNKLEKYVEIARKSRIYGMSMCKCSLSATSFAHKCDLVINPSCKKEGMKKHWPEDDIETCIDAVRTAVCFI